jgi:hypothetical protein
MTDIFFSYARTDQPRVLPIIYSLRAVGYEVFFDEDVPVGEWVPHLEERLALAQCMIVAVSSKSNKSKFVRKEILKFNTSVRPIIPIRIESIERPLLLIDCQSIDLIDWDETNTHPQWQKLVHILQEHLIKHKVAQTHHAAPIVTVEIERIERNRAALSLQINELQLALIIARKEIKAWDSQIDKFKPPKNQLFDLNNAIQNAELALYAHLDSGIDDNSFTQWTNTIKTLKGERIKIQKELLGYDKKNIESARKHTQRHIEQLGANLNYLSAELLNMDAELELWREKRLSLLQRGN